VQIQFELDGTRKPHVLRSVDRANGRVKGPHRRQGQGLVHTTALLTQQEGSEGTVPQLRARRFVWDEPELVIRALASPPLRPVSS
jgi:hypothetical protein